jgi:hypothetical protein
VGDWSAQVRSLPHRRCLALQPSTAPVCEGLQALLSANILSTSLSYWSRQIRQLAALKSRGPPKPRLWLLRSGPNSTLAILAIISKVLEFFRKMGKKVTYGKRSGGVLENDDRLKRSKTDDQELEEPRFPGRQVKKSSLLKKSLHSGPVSFTSDDGDISFAPKKKTSVFDKVLKEGRYQTAKPVQNQIRGRNSYLPTPPAEVERKAHQQARRDATFSHINGDASNGGLKTPNKVATPTQTSHLFERIIKDEQPRQPYKPKTYEADETAAPRRNIMGDRLLKKSKEAEM